MAQSASVYLPWLCHIERLLMHIMHQPPSCFYALPAPGGVYYRSVSHRFPLHCNPPS